MRLRCGILIFAAGLCCALAACDPVPVCPPPAEAAKQIEAEAARQKEADLQVLRLQVVDQCKTKGRALNMIGDEIYCQDK